MKAFQADEAIAKFRACYDDAGLAYEITESDSEFIRVVVSKDEVSIETWFDVTKQLWGFDLLQGGHKFFESFDEFEDFFGTYLSIHTVFIPNAKKVTDAFEREFNISTVYDNFSGNKKNGYVARFKVLGQGDQNVLVQRITEGYLVRLVTPDEATQQFKVRAECKYDINENGNVVVIPTLYHYWRQLKAKYADNSETQVQRVSDNIFSFSIENLMVTAEINFNYTEVRYHVTEVGCYEADMMIVPSDPYDLSEVYMKCKDFYDDAVAEEEDAEAAAEAEDEAAVEEAGSPAGADMGGNEAEPVEAVQEEAAQAEAIQEEAAPDPVADAIKAAEAAVDASEHAEAPDDTVDDSGEAGVVPGDEDEEVPAEEPEPDDAGADDSDADAEEPDSDDGDAGDDSEAADADAEDVDDGAEDSDSGDDEDIIPAADDPFNTEADDFKPEDDGNMPDEEDAGDEDSVVPDEGANDSEQSADEEPAAEDDADDRPPQPVDSFEGADGDDKYSAEPEDKAPAAEPESEGRGEMQVTSVKLVQENGNTVGVQFISDGQPYIFGVDQAEAAGLPVKRIKESVQVVYRLGMRMTEDERRLKRYSDEVDTTDELLEKLIDSALS